MKGLDLMVADTTKVFFADERKVKCCEVCCSQSMWLCKLMCKYRNALYKDAIKDRLE